MNGKTHVVWSLALGLILSVFLHADGLTTAELLVVAFICGLLPDVDHPKSMLGHWFKVVNYGVKHRGFMHSLWAIVVFVFFWWKLLSPPSSFLIVGACAYVLHLVLDTITPAGVNWLYPFSFGRIRGPIKSDGIVAFAVLIAGVFFFAVAVILYLQLRVF